LLTTAASHHIEKYVQLHHTRDVTNSVLGVYYCSNSRGGKKIRLFHIFFHLGLGFAATDAISEQQEKPLSCCSAVSFIFFSSQA